MTIPLSTLRRWIRALKPDEPLGLRDPRYVDLDEDGLRGRDGSCVEQLARSVLFRDPGEPSCFLFSGYPGTGKTTELRRLALQLEGVEGERSAVVFVDAEDYLDRYTPPSITDVLRILAWHLDQEALRAEGADPGARTTYLHRLWSWLQQDVEIKDVGLDVYGLKLMAEIKDNPNFRRRVEEVLQLRFQAFAKEAHEVIGEAIERIRAARGVTRVVVVVDGLEKLTALRPEDRTRMEECVESVFCSHVEWLRIRAHVIYTFPLWLRFRRPDLGTRFDAPPLVLPMVKVQEQDGAPCASGVSKLTELVFQRIDEPTSVFGAQPEAALRVLVEASGGYPRDLLRLVRDLLTRARSFPVGPSDLDRVVQVLAEDYKHATLLSDLTVLRYVHANHRLPDGDDAVRSAARLFDLLQVLTYRNGREWYALHPLVARSRALTEPRG
ncbi:MAG: hypothetical protein H6739_30700 [Alphaproteobacteria bacterium]|nr:hypothetical protein [Alphaproteobacteria bacterium]